MEIDFFGKKVNLLPCPFCGDFPAVRIGKGKDQEQSYKVFCSNEHCVIVETLYRSDLTKAAKDWNQRPMKRVLGGEQDA